MKCPNCNHETSGHREGDTEHCTHCGASFGRAWTPDGNTIRVYRLNLGTKKVTCEAGYDMIPTSLAIEYLNQAAEAEAKESRCTIKGHNYIDDDGRKQYERLLIDNTGVEVVKFFLRFPIPKS